MRTPLLLCVLAGFAAALSVRVTGAPPQHETPKPKPADAGAQAAPATPDFFRDVLPIVETNCLKCHSAAVQKGGLILDTHDDVMQGGENGTVLTPGNAAESRLVKMIQSDDPDLKMPPKSTLRPEEIATFRAWIDAGAKSSPDGLSPAEALEARLPRIRPAVSVRPAVNSLAYKPDGSELAVPGYREVHRIGFRTTSAPATAAPTGTSAAGTPIGLDPRRTLSGGVDLVRSVAYSGDGAWLAAAGGIPGAMGEVLLWNAATGALAHTLRGHRDYVYETAFNHRGTRLATCSYDKTVRVWDVEGGRPTHVFREHTEAVFAVAFSPDDKWIASGAGDRSVKIWDLTSGARLYTLTEPTDVVQTLAFHPTGQTLSAAGADKTIRTWTLTPQGGTQTRAVRAHNAAILRIVYSPDGKRLASSADDRTVKIWDTTNGEQLRELERQPDWPQGLAWSPDGARLAVGRYDGTIGIYDAATGRRLSQLALPLPREEPVRKAERQ